jgi:transcription initiation factor TFIID subunit 9B
MPIVNEGSRTIQTGHGIVDNSAGDPHCARLPVLKRVLRCSCQSICWIAEGLRKAGGEQLWAAALCGMEAPRDARAIAAILEEMGIEKYEPSVVHMLLEVLHGHVTSLLQGAREVADHAGKQEVDLDDLRLAAETHRSPVEPPPRTVLLALARERNAIPLPRAHTPAPPATMPLPPFEYQLVPQRGIPIEQPPKTPAKDAEAYGPWALSPEERKIIMENQQQRRKEAYAAAESSHKLATLQHQQRQQQQARLAQQQQLFRQQQQKQLQQQQLQQLQLQQHQLQTHRVEGPAADSAAATANPAPQHPRPLGQ